MCSAEQPITVDLKKKKKKKKKFGLKFHVGSQVQQETLAEGCIGQNIVNIIIKMKTIV